jgi:membrane protein
MKERMKDMMKRIWGLTVVGAVMGFLFARFRTVHPDGSDESDASANPTQFSLKDWKQALKAIKNAFGTKNLSILAAGVAYFSTLAFFPLMAAAVAIAALVIAPEQLQHVVATIDAYLPKDVADLITTQLQALTGRRADNILAAVLAIAISLFGASGASKCLVTAANVAYGVQESRGWLRQQLRGIVWTIGGIIFGFVVAVLLVINKTVFQNIGVFSPVADIILYSRWIVIIFLITLGLAFFYRYGPNRVRPQWQWISWGALTATVLWLAGTSLFFVYVQNFGHYGRSYSFFAGIIVLMIWLNLSAFTVLLGAAVNHGLEAAARTE